MDIQIWEPRWKDRVVLIAKFKVREHNTIVFTKASSLPGRYKMSGEQIRKYPLDTNGRVDCYAVPLDKLIKGEDQQVTLL